MKIAAPKETQHNETRVAISPETVRKFTSTGFQVTVEAQAGVTAFFSDKDYAEAGAEIATHYTATVEEADVVITVRAPHLEHLAQHPPDSLLIGLLNPYKDKDTIAACLRHKITAFAMELIPRITRAQAMDVLSSQANLAGYKAVIDAVGVYGRTMPMMMTAAGTIAPARVLIMGAGVAGLQAIATAKRLGAIVHAIDVRPSAKEHVESLGATFLTVDTRETLEAETAGGYAQEMSAHYQHAQARLIAEQIQHYDIVISTALVPGRRAPTLLTEEMVHSMKPGSVIVDLAIEQGGNCAISKPDEIIDIHEVKIIGYRNIPGRLPTDTSALYARNIMHFVSLMVDSGELRIDWEDEIIASSLLTVNGKIINTVAQTTVERHSDKHTVGE